MMLTQDEVNEAEWTNLDYEILNTGGDCWAAIKVVEGIEFWVSDYHETRHPNPAGALIVSAFVPNSGVFLDFTLDAENIAQVEANIASWAAQLQGALRQATAENLRPGP